MYLHLNKSNDANSNVYQFLITIIQLIIEQYIWIKLYCICVKFDIADIR